MLEFTAHLIVSGALLMLVAGVVRGFEVEGVVPALLGALVLGLVNAFVKPVAVLLTLPLTLLTFGLFYLVVNAFMLKLVAALVPGFRIRSFAPAFWGALVLSVLNLAVAALVGPAW